MSTRGYARSLEPLPADIPQIWAELHERAFRRLGGTVRVVVHDNLREGVLTPDIYDPTLNPLYRDVLARSEFTNSRSRGPVKPSSSKQARSNPAAAPLVLSLDKISTAP